MLSRRRIFYYVMLLTKVIVRLASGSTILSQNITSSSPPKFSEPFIPGEGFVPITSPLITPLERTNEILIDNEHLKSFDRENSPSGITQPPIFLSNSSSLSDENLSSSTLRSNKNKFDSFNTKDGDDGNVNEKEAMKLVEKFLLNYVKEMVSNSSYELFSGFRIVPNRRMDVHSFPDIFDEKYFKGGPDQKTNLQLLNNVAIDQFQRFVDGHTIKINVPRAVESGRLFFFKGLKKMMWTVFVGLQIAKTVLLALFLPSILGSLGKIVGKGITQVSGFAHPSETVNDLDFKDNTYNLDQEIKLDDYMYPQYPQGEASTNHFATQMYDSATANNNALSRFEISDQKLTYANSGMNMYGPKNSNSDIMSTKKNNFKDFLGIPASSLLLTNYDPFYSPLLSRMDAVFQQLGLQRGNEICREKLVCFMYSNPAKYAPYSNLVSAQLSRELNELRKPAIDNPDILRFFKYMKAAKDGQDGTDCESIYSECTSLKDTENPAMLTTYNDINKLVQARKFN